MVNVTIYAYMDPMGNLTNQNGDLIGENWDLTCKKMGLQQRNVGFEHEDSRNNMWKLTGIEQGCDLTTEKT